MINVLTRDLIIIVNKCHLEAPRQGVPPIWDLHMGVWGNTGVYGSWWELAGNNGIYWEEMGVNWR